MGWKTFSSPVAPGPTGKPVNLVRLPQKFKPYAETRKARAAKTVSTPVYAGITPR